MTPASSLGFAIAAFAEQVLGINLVPWQRWLYIHALELLPDGRFRFRVVLVLIGRQNGKTSAVEIKSLARMYLHKAQVLGTALDLDLSQESWANAVEMAEAIPELAAEIVHVDKTNGKKALRLTNGARWKVKTASRKGGRGFSVDDVNLDELREHYTYDAWGAVTKTTLARRNSQVWAYTNAGDKRSIVLNDLQGKARAALEHPELAEDSFALFEWSAPDDVDCDCGRIGVTPHGADCSLGNPEYWAMANPSLGYLITEDALRSAFALDPTPVFRTECLCQSVEDLKPGSIDAALWSTLGDPGTKRVGDVAVALDIAPDRSTSAIWLSGVRADGLVHWQPLDYRRGTDWCVPRLVEIRDALDPLGFGMGNGTFKSIAADLEKAGFAKSEDPKEPVRGDLAVLSAAEMSAACGQVLDAVKEKAIRHLPHQALDAAVRCAQTRVSNDSVAWARRESDGDLTPLVAATEALWVYESRAHLVRNADYNVLDSVY